VGTEAETVRGHVARERAPVIPGMRQASPAEWPRARPAAALVARTPGWKVRYTATSVAIDVAAALAAMALAVYGRSDGAPPGGYLPGCLALAPVWILFVALSRAYERRFIGVGTEEIRRVIRAGVAFLATVGFVSYAIKAEFARGYVITAVPAVVVLGLLGRCGLRVWLHRQRARGLCVQRAVLLGSSQDVKRTLQRLHRDSAHGMVVVGACLSDGPAGAAANLAVPVFGGPSRLDDAARATNADLVIVLSSALLAGEDLRRLAWRLEPTGAELIVCSGLSEIFGPRVTILPIAHSPMLHVSPARLSGPARVIKGALDRSCALIGLIVLCPLLVGLAALISFADGAGPIFRQKRVGLNGREFTVYKFRTMVPNAEALKADLTDRNEGAGVLFKMAQDPRVTPIGRWLRRYSIDELPQLVNVVRGEMSLVGPRPPLAEEVRAYGSDMRRRLLVKPGLTGLWQVSGRSDLSWSDAETLDLRYVENWSLGFDLLILGRTARAVVSGSGAY
jgi:exopolysaccharide biosynthesis polyprenyl glycosylphosphotransferase